MASTPRFLAFRDRSFFKPLFLILLTLWAMNVMGTHCEFFSHPALGFDKVMHFLGGVAVGIFGVLLLAIGVWDPDNTNDHRKTNFRIWVVVIGGAIIIGGLWEIAQYYIPGFGNVGDEYAYDTIGDMVFDTIGGIVAGLHYRLKS